MSDETKSVDPEKGGESSAPVASEQAAAARKETIAEAVPLPDPDSPGFYDAVRERKAREDRLAQHEQITVEADPAAAGHVEDPQAEGLGQSVQGATDEAQEPTPDEGVAKPSKRGR